MKQLKAIVAVLFLGLLALLPLRWAQRLGGRIGKYFAARPQSSLMRVTRTNIDIAFPEQAEAERIALAELSMIETGRSFSEMGMAWLWSPARSLKKVKAVHHEHLIDEALAQGHGVILIAPHLGNWEILNLYLSKRYPFTAMYRPPKLKLLDTLIKRMRARLGTRMAPADASGVRMVMSALKRTEMVGILPDQEPVTGGEWAPFFGHPAYTMKLLPQLVRKTKARVICGFAERLPGGEGFEIHFMAADERIYSADLNEALLGLNRSVEQCVKALPAQYQWEYKRFNHQPDGVVSPYSR